MFAKLTDSTNSLRIYFIGVFFIVVSFGLIYFAPNDNGSTGVYILRLLRGIVLINVIGWLIMLVGIAAYTFRRRSAAKTILLVSGAVLLSLPILLHFSVPNILREHDEALTVGNQTYQLAHDMLPYCPDTFDSATYRCYSQVYLYQCDSLGLLCHQLDTGRLNIQHENPLQMRVEGNAIEIISDDDQIAYSYPF